MRRYCSAWVTGRQILGISSKPLRELANAEAARSTALDDRAHLGMNALQFVQADSVQLVRCQARGRVLPHEERIDLSAIGN